MTRFVPVRGIEEEPVGPHPEDRRHWDNSTSPRASSRLRTRVIVKPVTKFTVMARCWLFPPEMASASLRQAPDPARSEAVPEGRLLQTAPHSLACPRHHRSQRDPPATLHPLPR